MWPNPAWQICFRGQRSGPREQRGRSSRSGSSTTTAPRKQIATSTTTTTTGARGREIWIKRISRRAGCLRTSRIIEWHFHFSSVRSQLILITFQQAWVGHWWWKCMKYMFYFRIVLHPGYQLVLARPSAAIVVVVVVVNIVVEADWDIRYIIILIELWYTLYPAGRQSDGVGKPKCCHQQSHHQPDILDCIPLS